MPFHDVDHSVLADSKAPGDPAVALVLVDEIGAGLSPRCSASGWRDFPVPSHRRIARRASVTISRCDSRDRLTARCATGSTRSTIARSARSASGPRPGLTGPAHGRPAGGRRLRGPPPTASNALLAIKIFPGHLYHAARQSRILLFRFRLCNKFFPQCLLQFFTLTTFH